MTGSVGAAVGIDVSIVGVVVRLKGEAFSSIVLHVSISSIVPSDLKSVVTSSIWSKHCIVVVELLVVVVGNDVRSLRPGSDGVSSSIPDEPLSTVSWEVIPDSKVVLVVTGFLGPVDWSSVLHSDLNLESNS